MPFRRICGVEGGTGSNVMNLPAMADSGVMPLSGTQDVRLQGGRVVSRRSLPGGRAIVGGLLVAASAVGLFAAYSGSRSAPSAAYVTVTRDIVSGEILQRSDLTRVAIDLPSGQRAVSFTDLERLIGTVALGRM